MGVQVNDNTSRTLKFVTLQVAYISLFQYYTTTWNSIFFFVSNGMYVIVVLSVAYVQCIEEMSMECGTHWMYEKFTKNCRRNV